MESDHLISHTIQIAGESYPVKLTEEEKQFAIEIENEINEKISEFKLKYLVKTTRDILAMVLLTYAFELKATKRDSTSLDHAGQRIERLIGLIKDNSDS